MLPMELPEELNARSKDPLSIQPIHPHAVPRQAAPPNTSITGIPNPLRLPATHRLTLSECTAMDHQEGMSPLAIADQTQNKSLPATEKLIEMFLFMTAFSAFLLAMPSVSRLKLKVWNPQYIPIPGIYVESNATNKLETGNFDADEEHGPTGENSRNAAIFTWFTNASAARQHGAREFIKIAEPGLASYMPSNEALIVALWTEKAKATIWAEDLRTQTTQLKSKARQEFIKTAIADATQSIGSLVSSTESSIEERWTYLTEWSPNDSNQSDKQAKEEWATNLSKAYAEAAESWNKILKDNEDILKQQRDLRFKVSVAGFTMLQPALLKNPNDLNFTLLNQKLVTAIADSWPLIRLGTTWSTMPINGIQYINPDAFLKKHQ
jgi:hypothetical protein